MLAHAGVGGVAHALVGMDVVQDRDRTDDVLERDGVGIPAIEHAFGRDLGERELLELRHARAGIAEHLPACGGERDGVEDGQRNPGAGHPPTVARRRAALHARRRLPRYAVDMEHRPTRRRRTAILATAVLLASRVPLAVEVAALSGDTKVVVNACVSGGVLSEVSAAAGDTSGRAFAPRYRLKGKKALVNEIKKEHAGHGDEFTGSITGDLASTGMGPGVDLGGVSVRVGGYGPNDQPNAARVPETPVFEVTSFRHTGTRCR